MARRRPGSPPVAPEPIAFVDQVMRPYFRSSTLSLVVILVLVHGAMASAGESVGRTRMAALQVGVGAFCSAVTGMFAGMVVGHLLRAGNVGGVRVFLWAGAVGLNVGAVLPVQGVGDGLGGDGALLATSVGGLLGFGGSLLKGTKGLAAGGPLSAPLLYMGSALGATLGYQLSWSWSWKTAMNSPGMVGRQPTWKTRSSAVADFVRSTRSRSAVTAAHDVADDGRHRVRDRVLVVGCSDRRAVASWLKTRTSSFVEQSRW